MDAKAAELQLKTGPAFFLEMRENVAAHSDTKTQGPTPDVWVPDASAWVRKASVDADAERMMPDLQPSLARSWPLRKLHQPDGQAMSFPALPVRRRL